MPGTDINPQNKKKNVKEEIILSLNSVQSGRENTNLAYKYNTQSNEAERVKYKKKVETYYRLMRE